MDMRFHWIRDQRRQGTYIITWAPGKGNDADYFSKAHPSSKHKEMRPRYISMDLTNNIPESPKGVLNPYDKTK